MRKNVKKQLKRMRIFMIFDSVKRTKYIVKHKIFKEVGNNFFFQPRKIPSDPELIKFHDNVVVTSGVTFITHDVTNFMLNNMNMGYYKYYSGCIEIMNNVFIGSNSIIFPNVKIGNNVIIGAGSVVTKDVKDGSVVAGNPAKVIETFDEYALKRKKRDETMVEYFANVNDDVLWEQFNKNKD